jgi:phosphatidylinositol alpha-mannosyltransferase
MRILQVCPYSWTSPGGVQRHIAGLSRALAERNHQVRIVAPGCPSPSLDPAVDIVGRPIGIPFNGSVAPVCFSGRSARRIRTVLRDWRPDIVHVHEPFAPSTSLLTTLIACCWRWRY